jgi:myo-inositol 2-dehydrogenase/D-chiro-inositol 1-dehydrogenase
MTSHTSTDPVRIGVIGTGAMGAAHVGNLASWVTGAAVTQIFDVDTERARAVADGVGASAAPTTEALIASG